MSNNKILGNITETLFLDKVQAFGGWATLIPPTHLGQPVDVVAVIKGVTYFVDIKHCKSQRFGFGSIQDNQELAMEKIYQASEKKYGKGKDIKIGFMIYFEPLQAFKFFTYGMYRSMLVNGERSVKMDDERLGKVNG